MLDGQSRPQGLTRSSPRNRRRRAWRGRDIEGEMGEEEVKEEEEEEE